MGNKLGIDLGGTKIEAIVINDAFQVVERKRIATNREEGYDAILQRIVNLAKELIETGNVEGPVGICTPGAIDYKTGTLKNSNTVCLIDKPLQSDLESALSLPLLMENDANCFALSEAMDGAAKNYNVVFGIIIGSGTGGGVVINKKIIRGANYVSGEWGHLPLPIFGNLNDKKYVKNKISQMQIQKFTSGKGLENLYHKKITAREIFNKSNKSVFIKQFKIRLARALVNVIYTLDPDIFVFGGGLSNEISSFTEIKKMVAKNMELKNINTKFKITIYHANINNI